MRKLLVFIVLCSSFSWAARTHVQTNVNFNVSGTTTVTVTLGANPTLGNTVCVGVFTFPTGLTNLAIKDSNNNSYPLTPHSPSRDTTGNNTGDVWLGCLLSAPGNASKTITATWTGTASGTTIIADEFSGASTLDKDAVASGTTGNTSTLVNLPSLTPTVSGELLYAVNIPQFHTINPGPGTPFGTPTWTGGDWDPATGGDTWFTSEYILSGTNGATPVQFNLSGTADDFTGVEVALGTAAPLTVHYIASNGVDTNNGTAKATPWAHAPGMVNCANNCASYTPVAGDQIIFRGGDTWHFGNSAATPYVGAGTWNVGFTGTATNCDPSDTVGAVRTSCIYIGVDQTWFSGASWVRPIMSGDNPTSKTAVASCSFPTTRNFFSTNNGGEFLIIDNFEWTGMCQPTAGGQVAYMDEESGATKWNIYSNNYAHGITHVPYNCGATCYNTQVFNVRIGTQSTIGPGNICDGWDSDPGSVNCDTFGGYLIYDNVFGNYSQLLINGCHDTHDNIMYNYSPTGDGVAHGNAYECNEPDAPRTDNAGASQPAVPINVFYNNVHLHDAAGNATAGDVKIWWCPEGNVTEYYFGNVMYDVGTGNTWNLLSGGCSAAPAKSFKFNNTLAINGSDMDCPATLTSVGNHIITNSGGNGYSGTACSTNDTVMTYAQAATQGYAASGKGVTGNNGNVTCANDTTPCAPTLATNSTVNGGTNEQSLCTAMLNSTQSMIHNAGMACKSDTTDACTYNTANRTVSCPGRTTVSRPSVALWDSGAYEFSGSTPTPASPPSCSPGSGNYSTAQNVTCTNPNPGTTIICFTLDNSKPVTNGLGTNCTHGTIYTPTILINTNVNLSVVAGTSVNTDSSVVVYNYTTSAIILATDCQEATVSTALGSIQVDTTTVGLPAGPCSWVNKLSDTQTNSFVLQGAGAQHAVYGTCGNGSCSQVVGTDQTIIQDNDTTHGADNALLAITLSSANKSLRITGIDFQWGNILNQATPGNGEISISGTCGGTTACNQVRLDNNHLDATQVKVLFTHWGGWVNGVVDHNYLAARGTIVSSNYGNMGSEVDGSGNVSWNTASQLGTSNFLFVEDNYVFSYQPVSHQGGALTDCDHGGRIVARYNNMVPSTIDTHEQAGGTSRSCRAWEFYKNNQDFTNSTGCCSGETPQGQTASLRGGTGVIWGNTVNNITEFVFPESDRSFWLNGTFGGFPPNGYGSCLGGFARSGVVTVGSQTAANSQTLTWVSGDQFDPTWANIVGQGPSPSGPAIAVNAFSRTGIFSVASATSLVLTVADTADAGLTVPYHTGSVWDGNTNNLGYPCLDQVGRGIGDLITGTFSTLPASSSAIDSTVTTAGGPGGLGTIAAHSQAGVSGYVVGDTGTVSGGTGTLGQYQVTAVTSGAPTGLAVFFPGNGYTCSGSCATAATNNATTVVTGSGNGALHVDIKGIAVWPNEALEPFYVFHNTILGSPSFVGVCPPVASGGCSFNVFSDNQDFYQQYGTGFETGSNCIASTCNITVGVNEAARAPINGPTNDACNPLVGWWDTANNTLYQCQTANTWTAFYTPFTYPHPLQASGSPPPPPAPSFTMFTQNQKGPLHEDNSSTVVDTCFVSDDCYATGNSPRDHK